MSDAPPLDQVSVAYLGDFAPRTDAYADWLVVEGCDHGDECRCHWASVRAELTPQRVEQGLRGGTPVSSYMEDAAGFTHVAAIDFDRDDGWELAKAVAARIAAAGGSPMIERSRRGAHLWLVLDGVVGGDAARLALREWVRQVNPWAARDPKVEILPKRLEQRGPETVGSPLRMPMMPHPKTGKRYPLCDPDGTPLGPSISAIVAAVDLTSAALVTATAARAKVPASEARSPEWLSRPSGEVGDVVSLLVGAGVTRAAPRRTVRCPFHDDHNASMSVAPDGGRAFCKNPECVAYNGGRGLGSDQLARLLGVNA